MKWFYNFKISTKMLSGFVLVALIAAVVGVVGTINIKNIDSQDTKMYEKMLVPIEQMGMISTAFQRMRANVLEIIVENDVSKMSNWETRANDRFKEIETISEEFKKTILSDEMKNMFDQFETAEKDYEVTAKKIIEFAKVNKDSEAFALWYGDAEKQRTITQDLMTQISDKKTADAKILSDENTQMANTAVATMITLIVIAVILSILLGLFIANSVSKPLKKALNMIQEMSMGHLNLRLKMDTKDEVGQMANAMDGFADDLQNMVVGTMKKISDGDVSTDVVAKDDKDEISPALKQTIETIRSLVAEANMLSRAAVEGKLDTRGNASKFKGGYKDIVEGVNKTLDSVIGPLNVAAEYVDRISKGDIPPKITDSYNGDFNEIKNNLNTCIDAVNALVADAAMLSKAAVEGKLDTRANASKHGGDFAKIVNGVNQTLDSVIGPLNVAAEYVDRISKGDIPPKITDNYNGDFNEIKNNLNMLIDSINTLISEMQYMSTQHDLGDIDIVVTESKFDGVYKVMAKGVNDMVNGHIAVKKKAMACVAEFGKGNFEAELEKFPGKKVFINNTIEQVRVNLKALIADADMLVKAAVEGKLDTRADATRHQGDFRKIVEGVNKTLDSVIGPLNVAAEYVDRISKGDIPAKITDNYNGDFNEIKNNLNTCIGAVNALVADAAMLSKAAVEGKLDTRADASKHGGDFAKIVNGVNQTLDAVIGPLNVAAEYVDRISKGDIPPKITDSYNGDFNEIKNNLNTCIDAVNALAADAAMLSIAAVEGKLSTRADASKHGGDFGKIVNGVNKTLDSVIGPLNVAADYVDKISKGNIPAKITDSYNGDFNAIKNNLNTCIDAVNTLVSDANMLSIAAVEGKLSTRADVSKHGGDFAKIVDGVNKTLDAVIKPVQEAAGILNEMSNGNLQLRVRGDYKGDHAEIKNALNDTLDALSTYVDEIASVLTEMANSNMVVEIANDYKGDFAQIKEALNLILQSFNQVLSDINNAADQVAAGSRQVSDGSQALSQGATEQASSIEQLTASITEIAAQTKQNAISANEANGLALTAKNNATEGNDQMKDMLKAMEEINVSSANISKIIKVIDEIAFQTNILALNAAVEAARAGQHGKGFAVVAEEVRNLAARSASAAKETTGMIEGSIKKVEIGTKIANETATALDRIVNDVAKAATLVGTIANASNEQATGIAQVNQGVEQVSMVVQTNSATAEESAAASEELSSQADLLKEMIGRFKLKNGESQSGKGHFDAGKRMLSDGGYAKKQTVDSRNTRSNIKKNPKIALSDAEFGKY